MKEAKYVVIGEKKYKVAGIVTTGSRGREYQLADGKHEDGSWRIVRVCHAPPYELDNIHVGKANTSGEWITYQY